MSKTLEELGYEKIEYGKSYDTFSKSVDEEGYCIDSIVFYKKHKNIKINAFISLEELKAIYKYCEDNKWIEDEISKLKQELKEKEEIIKNMQDELKHIPSIVSETM